MSIKKSQVILKCFIDLKSSVWFTLGSEDDTMFCHDTWNFFQLDCRSRFSSWVFKEGGKGGGGGPTHESRGH